MARRDDMPVSKVGFYCEKPTAMVYRVTEKALTLSLSLLLFLSSLGSRVCRSLRSVGTRVGVVADLPLRLGGALKIFHSIFGVGDFACQPARWLRGYGYRRRIFGRFVAVATGYHRLGFR